MAQVIGLYSIFAVLLAMFVFGVYLIWDLWKWLSKLS